MYAHLRSCEEILKHAGELIHASKAITFFPHNHPSTSNSLFTTNGFVQRLNHKSSKDELLISKMFEGILSFERKYNKQWEEKN
jgi:hypothetical protein